ncbi:MAG: LysR family transcriptional regulator [Zoogloeaceae bacterium]|jgi:DNA-binding transcriptional LysR family regulator|nr:LysR family transcriptional regulator [Zoogloeaceae bacterium]
MFGWENLHHFLAVARAGSLSGAARALRVDHATVSRRLTMLESELRVSLVERLPRSCRLTPLGVQIHEHALAMETAALAVARLAQASQGGLSGKVTLSAPPVLTTHLLAGKLAAFRAEYPDIRLAISGQAQPVSLSRREADIALRLARPQESSYVVRKLGQMPFALYASPDYVASHPPPNWTFIVYDAPFAETPLQQWLLGIAGNRPTGGELNDISSHKAAACAGVGVAGLPCFLGDQEAGLVRLAHEGATFSRDIWLVVHRDLRRSAPIRAVMDFVATVVTQAFGPST